MEKIFEEIITTVVEECTKELIKEGIKKIPDVIEFTQKQIYINEQKHTKIFNLKQPSGEIILPTVKSTETIWLCE